MSGQETDSSSGSTASNSGIRNALGNFWTAATSRENQRRLKTDASGYATSAINAFTAMVNGQNPFAPEAPAPAPSGSQETPAPTGEETASPEQSGQAQPPAQPPAQAAPTQTTSAPPTETPPAEEEGMSWIATAMFNFLPDGVKEWAATASIPLATQGQALIQQHGKPKISKSPAAFFTCMQGDKITEVPQAVHDYAKKLIKMLGLGENEDLAMAISVGFISFLRKHLSFLPGVKAFESATSGSGRITDLIGFGTNAQTLLGLFNLAPAEQNVEPMLISAFKDVFRGRGVATIDNYFPTDQMHYSQFVEAYARLGRDMIAERKWTPDASKITEEMEETVRKIFEKYNISDHDGSLGQGLLLSAVHSADLLKSLMAGPAAPAAPGPAQPAAGSTNR